MVEAKSHVVDATGLTEASIADNTNRNSPAETSSTTDEKGAHAWLEQLSIMNNQIFIITNKDMHVEFISQSTREFLELDFEVTKAITPFPYQLVMKQLTQKGYFGKGNPREIAKRITSQYEAIFKAPAFTSEEINLITPSGRHIHIKQMVTPDGKLLLTGNDITQDYIESHALKLALDSNQSGYGIFSQETQRFAMQGNILHNHFGAEIVDNLTLQSLVSLIHPDDYTKCLLSWQQGMADGKAWEINYRMVDNNNQSIWIKGHYTPQTSKDGQITHVICFFSEITDTVRIQNELRQETDRTQNALKAKNDFIGRLSHEMRTPMNAVIGIADALVQHNKSSEINPKLELIQSSAEKILRILDETLQHAKLEEHKVELNPRVTSPSKCIETLCNLWEEKAIKSEIKLSYQIDKNVPNEINFDDFRFEQCLNNLISNAIKFTAGGEIKVIQTLVQKASKSYLITAVKDNGIGMTPAQLDNVFEAFTQADRSISGRFGGTGLGMNITKNIIELMGGRISVKSEAGQGSTFILSLPLDQTKKIPKAESSKAINRSLVETLLEENTPEPSKYENMRILVVDDNPTNHLVVKSLLETIVGKVITANNGIEAIQALESQSVDMIFMDIHMPIMDGIEATLAIRGSDEAFADVPIIALTADPQYQQKRLCKNIGMNGALGKPVRLSDLINEIENVLESQDVETQTKSLVA